VTRIHKFFSIMFEYPCALQFWTLESFISVTANQGRGLDWLFCHIYILCTLYTYTCEHLIKTHVPLISEFSIIIFGVESQILVFVSCRIHSTLTFGHSTRKRTQFIKWITHSSVVNWVLFPGLKLYVMFDFIHSQFKRGMVWKHFAHRTLQVIQCTCLSILDNTLFVGFTKNRLEICQKIYTTQFSGTRILHTEHA